MHIVSENSEETLYEDLKSFWEKDQSYRCLHLKFSQTKNDREDILIALMETFVTVVGDRSPNVYICHDNDFFIVNRSMTNKMVAQLLTHLKPKLELAQVTGLATLFEVGVNWPELKILCERRIALAKEAKGQRHAEPPKEEKKEISATMTREEALNVLNENLIKTIPLRRSSRKQIEILIVEDDPLSQRLISNALKNDYKLSIASDGQGALMSYINKAPDVMFLDIGLPDITGHDVLEKVFEYDPDAYVVMFSGHGDRENVLKAIELGAKGFVGKPFTRDKLLQYIDKSPFIKSKKI